MYEVERAQREITEPLSHKNTIISNYYALLPKSRVFTFLILDFELRIKLKTKTRRQNLWAKNPFCEYAPLHPSPLPPCGELTAFTLSLLVRKALGRQVISMLAIKNRDCFQLNLKAAYLARDPTYT